MPTPTSWSDGEAILVVLVDRKKAIMITQNALDSSAECSKAL